MQLVRGWEEEGVTVPAPYNRTIKVLLAPDKNNVPEITMSYALIHSMSCTDKHTHDRPELIIIVSGRGKCVTDSGEYPVEPDTVIWCEANEVHQMVNTGYETLKLATVFLPAYTAEENYARCVEAAKAAAAIK